MCRGSRRRVIRHSCSQLDETYTNHPLNPLPEDFDAYPRVDICEPTTAQRSPFFRLPAELRNDIYNYVFPQQTVSNWKCQTRLYESNHASWQCLPELGCSHKAISVCETSSSYMRPSKPPSQLGLLLTCRQIWSETAITAFLSLNINVVSLSACRDWKKTLEAAPSALTSQLATVMDTLQFIHPKRCNILPKRRMDVRLNLKTRYLIFSADELASNLEKKIGDNFASNRPGSTYREMWYLVRGLPGVVEVSLWTKHGSNSGQILLDLQLELIIERMSEDELRSKGMIDSMPFKVGAIDRVSKSFAMQFAGSKTTRTVIFKMI